MTCKHVFTGSAEGVKCQKCGLTLTAEEYRSLKQKKPQRKTAGKGGKS